MCWYYYAKIYIHTLCRQYLNNRLQGTTVDWTQWTFKSRKVSMYIIYVYTVLLMDFKLQDVPMQKNGFDCGVFLCQVIEDHLTNFKLLYHLLCITHSTRRQNGFHTSIGS